METQQRPKLLYPTMVIAAIAVTVFSLLGIAALTGTLPFAHSATSTAHATDEQPERTVSMNRRTSEKVIDKNAASVCANCGVVESVHVVEIKGQGSGIGAVAGGITGALLGNGIGQGNGRTAVTILGAAGGAYAGNEIEKNTKKYISFRVRVRMANGDVRTLNQREAPNVTFGDRVKIVDGNVVQQS